MSIIDPIAARDTIRRNLACSELNEASAYAREGAFGLLDLLEWVIREHVALKARVERRERSLCHVRDYVPRPRRCRCGKKLGHKSPHWSSPESRKKRRR